MTDYFADKTANTPGIEMLYSKGIIRVEGRAIPEFPGNFFMDFITRLNSYYKNPRSLTKYDIKLDYVNSGSSKYILEILRIIRNNYEKGHDCIINWYYEEDDESIQQLGLYYQDTIRVPFRLIEYF